MSRMEWVSHGYVYEMEPFFVKCMCCAFGLLDDTRESIWDIRNLLRP